MVQTAMWTTSYRVPDTLASDTEESVVGTQWHQEASSQLADMLRDVAARRGATWSVCEWIALIGLQHEDSTDYDPKPDMMVLRQPLPSGNVASVRLDSVGAPLFVAEIAGDSTKGNDQGDKKYAYAAIGVAEYVVFDPDGTLLPEPFISWRLQGGSYVPWQPEADGWRHSRVLDVSFRAPLCARARPRWQRTCAFGRDATAGARRRAGANRVGSSGTTLPCRVRPPQTRTIGKQTPAAHVSVGYDPSTTSMGVRPCRAPRAERSGSSCASPSTSR